MRRSGRGVRSGEDPFAVLGLAARADVTDDDVRAAWRRIAAATHPDRDDGGDPARFAAAAAAYATLRTAYGRGEALADMREAGGGGTGGRLFGTVRHFGTARYFGIIRSPVRWPRLTRSRRALVVLGPRLLVAAAVSVLAVVVAGWSPGSVAVVTGLLTWVAAAWWRMRAERPADL